jgi:hypothetical protein
MSKFRTSRRIVEGSDVSYTAEAARVQERAARRAPSVIRLGAIVFFSTATGDAWMLDINGGEAACLARDGVPANQRIDEGAASHRLSSITGAVFNAESAELKAMLRARRGLRVYGLKTRAEACAYRC